MEAHCVQSNVQYLLVVVPYLTMYKFENTGTGECECPKSVEAPMFVKPAVRGSLGNGACEIGKKKEK